MQGQGKGSTPPPSRRSTDTKRSPESSRYDELKGKAVIIELGDPNCTTIHGVLNWVDRYSVGVMIQDQLPRPPKLFLSRAANEPVILMKQHIVGIARWSS